jgi:hypothetical protein
MDIYEYTYLQQLPEHLKMYFDGSLNIDSAGAGVMRTRLLCPNNFAQSFTVQQKTEANI